MRKVSLLLLFVVTVLCGCSDKPATDHLPPILGSVSVTPYTSYAILACEIEGNTDAISSCGFEVTQVDSESPTQIITTLLQGSFFTVAANNLNPKTEYAVTAFIDNGKSRILSERAHFITADIPEDPYCFFEDKVFEEFLISKYDTDHNGKLSENEALNVGDLDMLPSGIRSLKGIEQLKNLHHLTCDGCQISFLDASGNGELQYLDCSNCKLDSINITGLSKLLDIHCNDNRLTTIDFSGCSSLSRIVCCSNLISVLDITPCSKEIRNLHCAPMNDPDGNNVLKTVYVLKDQSVPLNQLPNQTAVVVVGN